MSRSATNRADRFQRAHEETTLDGLSEDDLRATIRSGLHGVSEVEVNVDDFAPTDNAARPRSILVGDCTVEYENGDHEDVAIEVQAIEEHVHHDAETHEDGTVTIPVDGDVESSYRYDTLEVETF